MVSCLARRCAPPVLAVFLAACGSEGESGSGGAGPLEGSPNDNGDSSDVADDESTPENGSPEPAPEPSDDPASPDPANTAPAASDAPGAGPPASPGAGLLVPALRLTRDELDQVLSDLLLDESAPARGWLAEDEYSPFDNDFERQTVSQALVDSVQHLAEDVAARAVANPEAHAKLVPCTPAAPDDVACFDQVVRRVGSLFFRASVSDDDVLAYRSLLDFAAESGDFDVAVELLLTAFLQDPEFLYRLERGAAGELPELLVLNGHEVAARLSFLLWGTGPDEELMADAPDLASSDTRRSAASRLLGDARAQRQLFRFHAMWLGYRSLPDDGLLGAGFRRETEALIDRAVFDPAANYLSLFDSTETFVDDALAAHYGLPAPADGAGWVSYPEGSGRAGILSHGSVLSSFSKFSDTSPTQRGIFIRTRLLCQSVPPPPAVVDVDQPPGEGEPGCKIDRYVAHAEQSGCVECHSLFDPIGFGLENYDMQGRYREHDDGNPDCPIDRTGELPGYGEFRGPGELANLLLDNQVLEGCFARQYLSHALGTQELDAGQSALAEQLGVALSTGGDDLTAWLLDFVSSDAFALRPEEAP